MILQKQAQPAAARSRPRLAVCLCECAGTLDDRLDLSAIAAAAGRLPGVTRVVRCHALCQPGGPDQLVRALKGQRISRALIAACTPAYYRTALDRAFSLNNINPHLVSRVNIREHCAWVHPDRSIATQKSSRLIASAVGRLRLAERVGTERVSLNGRVLVIGAGLAGMQAALALADKKHAVTLITASDHLGGRALQQSIIPEAAERARQLAKRIRLNRRISVLTATQLRSLTGRFGQFQAELSQGQVDCGAVVVATGRSQLSGPEQLPAITGVLTFDHLARMLRKNRLSNLAKHPSEKRIGLILDLQAQQDRAASRAALKLASRARLLWGCETYLFCCHLRLSGPDQEQQYQQARQDGVVVIKSLLCPQITQEVTAVRLKGVDEQIGRDFDLVLDLLAVADVPLTNLALSESKANGQADLSSKLRTGRPVAGLIQRDNVFLLPVDSGRKGIFFAGSCRASIEWCQALDDGSAAAEHVHALLPASATRAPAKLAEVDPAKCAYCLTCYRSCPHGAIGMDQDNRAAIVEPIMCQACGVCVAECPAKAVDLVDYTDSQLSISPALPGSTVVFACENSALLAADRAGLARMSYSPDVAIVPVPCAGRIDPIHVLRALQGGAEKVLILGCHDEACKYLHGITRARARIERLRSQLVQLGLDPDCVQIGSLMAADAGRFVDFVSGGVQEVSA